MGEQAAGEGQPEGQENNGGDFQLGEKNGFEHSVGEASGRGGQCPCAGRFPGRRRQGGLHSGVDQGTGDSRRGLLDQDRGQRCRRHGNAAAQQLLSQAFSSPRQPALDRAHGPTQQPCRLLVRLAFEVTEDNGRAIALRQAVQLLVENRLKVAARLRRSGLRLGHGWDLPFAAALPGPVGPGPQCRMVSDGVQPAGQRTGAAEETGAPVKHQEGGLKSVLGVLAMLQDTPAHPKNHGAVPLDQQGKCSLVAVAQELLEKLTIADVFARGRQSVQFPNGNPQRVHAWHGAGPLSLGGELY